MVKVLKPEPVTAVGLKVPVTRDGNPDTPRLTVPLNPSLAARCRVLRKAPADCNKAPAGSSYQSGLSFAAKADSARGARTAVK
jgi:hypothetical protein